MVDRATFNVALEDLEQVTTPLTEDARRVYYEQLNAWPASHIARAIKVLLQTYRAKRFPSVAVFRRVLDHIEAQDTRKPVAEAPSPFGSLGCPACGDRGWWVTYKTDDVWPGGEHLPMTPHYVVELCQCDAGRRRKEGIELYYKRLRAFREKREARKNEPFESITEEEQ